MQVVNVGLERGERFIALLLLALGFYTTWQSFLMPAGTFSTPGPGFFPRIIGILLTVAAASVLLRGVWRKTAQQVTQIGHRDITAVVITLLVAAALFMPLGAIPTLGLMSGVIVKILRKGPWWSAALFGAIAAGTAWFVFVWLLGVQLPVSRLF
jgi:hypothetical protein